MNSRRSLAALAAAALALLAACTGDGKPTPASTMATSTARSTDALAAASSAAEASRIAQVEADRVAAEESARVAAEQSAQSAAAEASAQSAAAQAAAQSAAEQAAAEQAEADAAAAEAERVAEQEQAQFDAAVDAGLCDQAPAGRVGECYAEIEARVWADATENGWYDSRGWVSPQTARRALAAGIPPGGDVPGYLRCGTICGEDPTSGEVQSWNEGLVPVPPGYESWLAPNPVPYTGEGG